MDPWNESLHSLLDNLRRLADAMQRERDLDSSPRRYQLTFDSKTTTTPPQDDDGLLLEIALRKEKEHALFQVHSIIVPRMRSVLEAFEGDTKVSSKLKIARRRELEAVEKIEATLIPRDNARTTPSKSPTVEELRLYIMMIELKPFESFLIDEDDGVAPSSSLM